MCFLSLTQLSFFPGIYSKPSLSAHPSSAVPPGRDVTLKCQTPKSFNQFVLYKEGDTGPYKGTKRWYGADFPITKVTAAHSGTYQCYSFSSSSPYLWSAPSDPLVLVVTGKWSRYKILFFGICNPLWKFQGSQRCEQGEPPVLISFGDVWGSYSCYNKSPWTLAGSLQHKFITLTLWMSQVCEGSHFYKIKLSIIAVPTTTGKV